jgi:hypothetical protein
MPFGQYIPAESRIHTPAVKTSYPAFFSLQMRLGFNLASNGKYFYCRKVRGKDTSLGELQIFNHQLRCYVSPVNAFMNLA